MQIIETGLEGLYVIKPNVFCDERGYFFESFNQQDFNQQTHLTVTFVQDNESMSQKGVVRGLHFQKPPFAQGKLIRVIKGKVLDVVVDIRKHSKTYGKHYAIELNEENKAQLWVPVGFAHGFVTLADNTIFAYKCTDFYHPQAEGGILWNDPDMGIDWQTPDPILSKKDQCHPLLSQFETPFN